MTKYIPIIIFLLFSKISLAVDIEYCPDTESTVVLTANEGVSWSWSTGETTRSITYDVTNGPNILVQYGVQDNVTIENGDFQSRYTGFYSDYGYDSNPNPNTFYISSNFQNNPTGLRFDHTTGNGRGNWLMATVQNSARGSVILGKTINNLQTNTEYVFSFWVRKATQNAGSNISVNVNNTNISGIVSINSTDWTNYEYRFTTQSNTEAEIEIRFEGGGERIGLDDISLYSINQFETQYNLVPICRDCKAINTVNYEFCNGDALQLNVTPEGSCATIQWYNSAISTIVINTGCSYNTPTLFDVPSIWVYDSDSDDGCPRKDVPIVRKNLCKEVCGNNIDEDNDGLIDEACQPFVCDGTLFQINSDERFINKMTLDPINFTRFTAIPNTSDPIGYNPVDNFLYAILRNGMLRKIAADGSFDDIGIIYLPEGGFANTVSAGFGSDGLLYFMVGSYFYAVDVETLQVKTLNTTAQPVMDLALNPKDGFLYGVARNNLYRFDTQTGEQTNMGNLGITAQNAGSTFFDASGQLIIGILAGPFASVNIENVTGRIISTNNSSISGYDGTSCASAILMQKSASATTVNVGDTFRYTIDIFNETGGPLTNVNFSDVIDSRFIITNILTNELGTLDAGTGIGSNNLSISNMSINNGKTTLVFEVEVLPGQYCSDEAIPNQAFLNNLPLYLGRNIQSDNPATVVKNDPTIVNIIGAGASINPGEINPITLNKCGSINENITLENYVGSIKWQVSGDGNTWNDVSTLNTDTHILNINLENTTDFVQSTYYRAKVFCNNIERISNVLEVTLQPEVPFDLGNDILSCNSSLTLNAGVGFDSYEWSNGRLTQTNLVNQGTYTVTVTKGSCTITDKITVGLGVLPVITTLETINYCDKSIIQLNSLERDDASNSNPTYTFTFEDFIPLTAAEINNFETTEDITLKLIAANGICRDTASILIDFHELPEATMAIDNTNSCGDFEFEVDFSGTPNSIISYQVSNLSTTNSVILDENGTNTARINLVAGESVNLTLKSVEDENCKRTFCD